MTDPTAASSETATALQSALEAVYQEREALAQRLKEVDQLIADLQQAADTRSDTAARQPPRPSRKGTRTKAAQTRSQRQETRKAAGKKAIRRQQTGKAAAKKATQRKQTTKASTAPRPQKTAGARRGRPPAGEVGRTDRVVQLIAEADEPLSTGEVRSRLQQYESEVTSKLVSASLSYAQRRGRVHKTDEGRWAPAAGATGTAQGAQLAAGAQAAESSG